MPSVKLTAKQKQAKVEELVALLRDTELAVLTECKGVSTPDLRRLRIQLRPTGTAFHITKNTLLRLAAERTERTAVTPALQGPTAVAFVRGDFGEPIRALSDFARASRNTFSIKGGLFGNRLLTPEEVTAIATLPPREQLLAQVVGGFQAPLANLVYVLQNPLSALAYTLQARVDQLGGAEAA